MTSNNNNNNNNMNMGGGDDASDPSGMMMGEILNNMVGDEGGEEDPVMTHDMMTMMMHHEHDGDNNDELTSNGTITNETMVDDIILEDMMMLNDNDNMNSTSRHDHHHHHHHHEMMNHDDGHNNNNMNHHNNIMNHGGGSQSSGEIHHVHHGSLGTAGDNSNGFCKGQAGMVMFMEGFQFALKGESTCINLYFPGWTLDKAWKVVVAMIGVTLLAISTEAISKLRHNLSVKARSSSTTTTTTQQQRNNIQLIQIALHGIHALTGYILMLATMTYSLELLLCVILGLVIGYAIFGGDQYPHVSTNPCCAFLEDEAQDRDDVAQLLESDNDDVDYDDYDQTEVDIHGGGSSNECCMEQPIDLSITARNINEEGV